jgi:hypothetical protein
MVLFFGGVLMVDNQIYSNGQYGMYLLGLNDSTMLGNAIYGNTSHGILGASVLRNVFADGFLGYDLQGQPARNLGAEVMMNGTSSSPSSLTLKQVRVHPTVGISTTGFDANGISLLSYNQDDDTGTLKVYGSHTVSSTTLTLDFLSPIYPSTVTVAKLMLGAGHSITGIVTSNTNTRSELVTVTYIGSNTWSVVGTRSGVVGTVTCGASSTCSFSDTKFQFTLRTGATITVSDRLEFATIAATADSNYSKQLLFGRSANTLNGGRSKLVIDQTGGFRMVGVSTAPSLMGLMASSTYFTFVSSGVFTMAYATVTNSDENGLQLTGNKTIAIASSTFDLAGRGSSANGAYLTARSLTSAATFYGLVFNETRPSTNLYNVRVTGVDSGLNWLMRGWSGALGGKNHADDVMTVSNGI